MNFPDHCEGAVGFQLCFRLPLIYILIRVHLFIKKERRRINKDEKRKKNKLKGQIENKTKTFQTNIQRRKTFKPSVSCACGKAFDAGISLCAEVVGRSPLLWGVRGEVGSEKSPGPPPRCPQELPRVPSRGHPAPLGGALSPWGLEARGGTHRRKGRLRDPPGGPQTTSNTAAPRAATAAGCRVGPRNKRIRDPRHGQLDPGPGVSGEGLPEDRAPPWGLTPQPVADPGGAGGGEALGAPWFWGLHAGTPPGGAARGRGWAPGAGGCWHRASGPG